MVNFPQGQKGYDENYSVRWTGKVTAPKTGRYVFYVTVDDGVRLWLNGRLLIDKWINQAPTEHRGMIDLNAGELYDLKLEYFQGRGGHMITMSWEGPDVQKQLVPRTALMTLPIE